jgi:hypothetical protein
MTLSLEKVAKMQSIFAFNPSKGSFRAKRGILLKLLLLENRDREIDPEENLLKVGFQLYLT